MLISNLNFRAPKEITQILKMNASQIMAKGQCKESYNKANQTGALCIGFNNKECVLQRWCGCTTKI